VGVLGDGGFFATERRCFFFVKVGFFPFPKAPGVLFCEGVEKSGKQRGGVEGCGDCFAVA
jgi:hypothetical protein